MRSRTMSALALLLVAGAASAPAVETTAETRRLTGLYTSGFQNGPQRLRAEFRPAGDEAWKVTFHFRWSGEDRVYTGLAEGSLSTGWLRGRVENEDGQRTFTFRCEFDKKKRCKGRHAEVVRTGEHDTGTITLKE